MPSTEPIAAVFERHLAPILGPHTARVAVRTFALRARLQPAALRLGDVAQLCRSLEPMLRTFVGGPTALSVCERIEKELLP